MGTMLGKIHSGRVNTGMGKFEEGHDRTKECGISKEETGSSPAQLHTSRLLQRTEYAKQSRGQYQRKPLLCTQRLNRLTVIRERLIKFRLFFAKDLIPDCLTCEQ